MFGNPIHHAAIFCLTFHLHVRLATCWSLSWKNQGLVLWRCFFGHCLHVPKNRTLNTYPHGFLLQIDGWPLKSQPLIPMKDSAFLGHITIIELILTGPMCHGPNATCDVVLVTTTNIFDLGYSREPKTPIRMKPHIALKMFEGKVVKCNRLILCKDQLTRIHQSQHHHVCKHAGGHHLVCMCYHRAFRKLASRSDLSH